MEETSTITRGIIVTSAVAIVAALGTGLAVVTAGIGPAIPWRSCSRSWWLSTATSSAAS